MKGGQDVFCILCMALDRRKENKIMLIRLNIILWCPIHKIPGAFNVVVVTMNRQHGIIDTKEMVKETTGIMQETN